MNTDFPVCGKCTYCGGDRVHNGVCRVTIYFLCLSCGQENREDHPDAEMYTRPIVEFCPDCNGNMCIQPNRETNSLASIWPIKGPYL
jgi:hypothetical protein